MTTEDLISRARKVAELRARADHADATLDREDAELRAAIIDSVRDVLPVLASPSSGWGPAIALRERRIVPDRNAPVIAWLCEDGIIRGGQGRREPYALEVSEAISRALDVQLAGLPKAEARQLERAETLRTLTRLIRSAFAK